MSSANYKEYDYLRKFKFYKILISLNTMDNSRNIIKFNASTGFTVVLEFGNNEEMDKYQNKIKEAGLQCKTIPSFNINFDQADLFMDMRSPECKAQFDIDDWI